jgi:cytochrome c oxidase assembly factor CtaG
MIMDTHALLRSWSPPLMVNASFCIVTILYVGGWIRLHAAFPSLISAWRLTAFLAGLAGIWIAIRSPLAAFDNVSLTVHMVQHVLLMSVCPPLVLLGWPALPLLRGLPQPIARRAIGPVLHLEAVKRVGRVATNPVVSWLAAAFALIAWHVPGVFQAALRSDWLHELEHVSFLGTGLLFWWPVVQPWPSTNGWPRWSVPLYLFCATLPCDVLSGFLAFCDRVVYSSYLSGPRTFGISPLQDQECAAAFMWVSVTLILLVPAVMVAMEILSPPRTHLSSESRAILETAEQCLPGPTLEHL